MKTLKHQQKEWLEQQYIVNKYSADMIGKMSGCCGPIVLKWLRRFNIPIRKFSDPYFRSTINPIFKKYKNREWLEKKYRINEMSGERIAALISKEVGVKISGANVIKWMKRFGIERNNRIKGVYTKENHHNWLGGRYLKHGYWYLNIDTVQHPEHRYLVEQYIGRKLKRSETIHHINGNKRDNRLENLYIFVGEKDHQSYHHRLQMSVLSNLDIKTGIINLKKLKVNFITKSNLSSFIE